VSTPARLAGVGVFVLAGLALFTVGLFMIGDRNMAFSKKFIMYTEFKKITGLQPGASVRVSGAKAGAIAQILPPNTPGEKFRVKLEIAEDLHQLVRTDSLATIETEGLVGGSYLGIMTGTDAAPRVAADGTIAGKEPFDISDLMQQMGDTVAKVNAAIDEMKGDLQRAVTSMADAAGNANTLITDVSADLKTMAASGVKISADAAAITDDIRGGKGTIGKLVNDDELYNRTLAIARQGDEIAANAMKVVENARQTLEGFQSKDGPIQGMTANVTQTMSDARAAMAGFAENMEALKHNFLVRGFFKGRGYFNLAHTSPADYRKGVLTKGSDRRVVRLWLPPSDVSFAPEPEHPENERLTGAGKAAIDAAIAPYLEHIAAGLVIVEGYAQQGTRDQQYLRSQARATTVRDYLITKFRLDPEATGAMALGVSSADAAEKAPRDTVALAIILPKAAFAPPPTSSAPARPDTIK
jgi:phospholipid/cholesterol/gamma-HCH transport system substrate-binding protein